MRTDPNDRKLSVRAPMRSHTHTHNRKTTSATLSLHPTTNVQERALSLSSRAVCNHYRLGSWAGATGHTLRLHPLYDVKENVHCELT